MAAVRLRGPHEEPLAAQRHRAAEELARLGRGPGCETPALAPSSPIALEPGHKAGVDPSAHVAPTGSGGHRIALDRHREAELIASRRSRGRQGARLGPRAPALLEEVNRSLVAS